MPTSTTARPGVVWVNTNALERALAYARAADAPPGELLGAERALASRNAPSWRFTMLIQGNYWAVHEAILEHARFPTYSGRLLTWIVSHVDSAGLVAVEADDLATFCRVPQRCLYSALLDLEREPVGAITRLMKGRYFRGAQLTPKLHRDPAPRPERRPRAVAA